MLGFLIVIELAQSNDKVDVSENDKDVIFYKYSVNKNLRERMCY